MLVGKSKPYECHINEAKETQTEKFKAQMEKEAVSDQGKKTCNADGFSGEKTPQPPVPAALVTAAAEDSFYEKLSKLHESSGLSLIFNFRKTILDLHLLYREVIKRGGFYQVNEVGNWDEAATALNLKSFGSQLQKVYTTLLLPFEQTYSNMRKESKTSRGSGIVDASSGTGKRKHCDISSPSKICSGYPAEKRKSNDDMCPIATVSNPTDRNSTITTLSTSCDTELRNDRDRPLKPRSGYQIFLRLECHKLKMIHGERSSSKTVRDMAVDSWRHLTKEDKKPYIEASKMDKKRYERQMAAYNRADDKRNGENTQSGSFFASSAPRMINFSSSSGHIKDGNDYHVSLESDHSENIISPDESMVELAVEVMKKAEANDPMFQIDWENGYLDVNPD